jgi:hypothetical protein
MFNAARQFLAKAIAPKSGKGSGTLQPATGLPEMPLIETPKTPNKQVTQPGYVPNTAYTISPLRKLDSQAAKTDIAAAARQAANTPAAIRALARLTPDLSAATNAFLRVGIPEKWKVRARNIDGSFNREATQLANTILRQFDFMPDYASGFSQVSSLRSVCEALGKEGLFEGAMALELVLDKNRMPYKLQPVPVSQVVFVEDKNSQGIKAQQLVGGEYIDLDIPTFFYTSIDQDLLTAYGISPFESAVQSVLTAADFANDMRRICKRAVYPRYDVEIDEEKLRERLPPEILNDPEAQAAFMNGTIDSINSIINTMNPEDAIVHFDFFTVSVVDMKSTNSAESFDTVKNIFDEKVSTGAKVMPSILGHGSGSQNVASTETLVFMMSANGIIRIKLQELISKAITLGVRLFGQDVTVEFEFDAINLRPTLELESFNSMRQARILEQLSLGFLTDDEASIELTGEMTPTGFKPLSGTGFYSGNAAAQAGGAPGQQGDGTSSGSENPMGNKQGAAQQGQKSSAPSKPKGPQK